MSIEQCHPARHPEVPSPCVRNCCLNENDICLGCFRSLTEIVGWSEADASQRKTIILLALQRRAAHALK